MELSSTGSWADVTAQAERDYGPDGRAFALMARAEGMASKRLLSSLIEEAGYDVGLFLAHWGQVPSSDGLRTACRLQAASLQADYAEGAGAIRPRPGGEQWQ